MRYRVRLRRPWRLLALIGVLISSPALAINQVDGTGEPLFTNSASNTWYFKLTANVAAGDAYRITVRTYANGNNIQTQPVQLGPGNYNPLHYTDLQSGLQEGVTYQDCASGENFFSFLGAWTPDAIGSCFAAPPGTHTTIDRTKPNVQVFVNGTDTYSKSLAMSYRVDYQDALAPPFPANFVCRSFGTPGACPTFDYQAACSVPLAGNVKVNAFECTETLPATAPDGPVYFCARSADQAVPDIPGNPDQFTGSTADKANLSDVGCGNVILDRTPPSVSATANGASGTVTATVGQLITFAGQASDATSGVPGPMTWAFGDNTAAGAGPSVTHTYTQAGTFQASVTTTDGAGNPATGTVTVVVAPPPAGGTTPPSGSGTVTPPPTPTQISQAVGGGGTQTTVAAGLTTVSPKRVKITAKLKAIPLSFTAPGPGKVTVTLSKGAKQVAKAGTSFTRAGTAGFKLKLPRKLGPGAYKLKVTFTPQGGTAVTKSFGIRFTGPARIKEIDARPPAAPALTGAPSLTPTVR